MKTWLSRAGGLQTAAAARAGERGQLLPMVAVFTVGFLSMCAFVVDIGHVYVGFRTLQASTDAAALAGAQSLPATTASAAAASYSSAGSGLNASSAYSNVSLTTTLKCLATLTSQGIACVGPANANAIQVQQTATVSLYFARIFGTSSLSVTATATAAMRGAVTTPYNLAVILDTTGSMSNLDSGDCNATRMSCELLGVRTLLAALSPCAATQSSCGAASNGVVANAVDNVSLFAFPNVIYSTAPLAYSCSGLNPVTVPYTFPPQSATQLTLVSELSGLIWSPVSYQITPFQSDYRLSDSSASLNASSNLTKAVGGASGCTGMGNPGGQGTYYAAALYAAQSSLVQQQSATPGSQNVIILLSDGDASANILQMANILTSTTGATASGSYPSYVNECQQGVTAAAQITAAGTRVYTVAYGAAATSGCTTDTGTYLNKPCNAMKNMASSPAYFFSDYTATQNTGQCVSASQPTTSLSQIFTQIAGSFTAARLIPDTTQ